MIRGSRSGGRGPRAACVAACLCLPPVSPALEIDALMASLAAAGDGETTYSESLESALLTQTIVSRGTLTWRAPEYLEKHVLEPRPERYVVDGGELTIDRGQREPRTLRLADVAPLAAMVEAFRAALTGNRAALERHFELSLEGDARSWELRLVPRDQALARRVSAVLMRGRGGALLEVETVEVGGDRSLLRLGAGGGDEEQRADVAGAGARTSGVSGR